MVGIVSLGFFVCSVWTSPCANYKIYVFFRLRSRFLLVDMVVICYCEKSYGIVCLQIRHRFPYFHGRTCATHRAMGPIIWPNQVQVMHCLNAKQRGTICCNFPSWVEQLALVPSPPDHPMKNRQNEKMMGLPGGHALRNAGKCPSVLPTTLVLSLRTCGHFAVYFVVARVLPLSRRVFIVCTFLILLVDHHSAPTSANNIYTIHPLQVHE